MIDNFLVVESFFVSFFIEFMFEKHSKNLWQNVPSDEREVRLEEAAANEPGLEWIVRLIFCIFLIQLDILVGIIAIACRREERRPDGDGNNGDGAQEIAAPLRDYFHNLDMDSAVQPLPQQRVQPA